MRTVRSQFARMPGPDAGAAPTIAVVAISEDLLEPYRQADTTADAERVLDELAAHRADLPVPIGDLFDELAEASAEEDDYELAAHLERKALDAGCTRPLIAREMLGWYLLKSGALEQASVSSASCAASAPTTSRSCSRWATRGRTQDCRRARCARSTKRLAWPSASA